MATIGKNYKSGRTFDEVLALIKRDLKDALPKGVKISVRKDRSLYIDAFSVCVMQAPEEVMKWYTCSDYENSERYISFVHPQPRHHRMTDYGVKLFDIIEEVILSYYYNDSDVMRDYFDVNFYYEMGAGRFQKPFRVVSE